MPDHCIKAAAPRSHVCTHRLMLPLIIRHVEDPKPVWAHVYVQGGAVERTSAVAVGSSTTSAATDSTQRHHNMGLVVAAAHTVSQKLENRVGNTRPPTPHGSDAADGTSSSCS